MITQEYLKTLFDYKNGQLFWKINRGSNKTQDKKAGCVDGVGYQCIGIDGKVYRAHRLIWIWHNGNIDNNLQIDHIDRNRLNNQIDNLRLVTLSENQWNRKAKGTSYHKRSNTWNAKIQAFGKRHSLGYFETEHEAHEAYLYAKNNLHNIESRL